MRSLGTTLGICERVKAKKEVERKRDRKREMEREIGKEKRRKGEEEEKGVKKIKEWKKSQGMRSEWRKGGREKIRGEKREDDGKRHTVKDGGETFAHIRWQEWGREGDKANSERMRMKGETFPLLIIEAQNANHAPLACPCPSPLYSSNWHLRPPRAATLVTQSWQYRL